NISDEGPGPTETKRTCDVRSCLRRAFFTGTSSRRGARWGKGGHGGKATYEGGPGYRGRPRGGGTCRPGHPLAEAPRSRTGRGGRTGRAAGPDVGREGPGAARRFHEGRFRRAARIHAVPPAPVRGTRRAEHCHRTAATRGVRAGRRSLPPGRGPEGHPHADRAGG